MMRGIKRQKIFTVRESLVDLTGDVYAAAVLGQMLYWSLRTSDMDQYIEEERKRMRQSGIDPEFKPTYGWIYKTASDLCDELLEICSRQTVNRRLQNLVEAGCLERRRNPNHKWDRTWQYRPDLKAIREALEEHGWSLEDALPGDEWTSRRPPIAHSEQCNAQSEQSNVQSEQSNVQSEQAIPETTTETTKTETTATASAAAAEQSRLTLSQKNGFEALRRFGVYESTARELARLRSEKLILDWIEHARAESGLHNPPAFVVAKLRDGEEPPKVSGSNGRDEYSSADLKRGDPNAFERARLSEEERKRLAELTQ
jgi:hypothetical protein